MSIDDEHQASLWTNMTIPVKTDMMMDHTAPVPAAWMSFQMLRIDPSCPSEYEAFRRAVNAAIEQWQAESKRGAE